MERNDELPEPSCLPAWTQFCRDECKKHLKEVQDQLKYQPQENNIMEKGENLSTRSQEENDGSPAEVQTNEPSTSKSLKVHTKLRRFKCQIEGCNKSFAESWDLISHERRHKGERPFACTSPGCPWRFCRSGELARHMKTHTGLKPHTCQICQRRFAQTCNLKRHVKKHSRQQKTSK